jgi:hypothetical protein
VTSDQQVTAPVTSAPERSAITSVSWAVRAAAMWAVCLLAVVAAGYVGVKLFERVSLIAFAFILSLFFTAVLVQLVDRLTRLGMRRTLATALVLVAGIAVLVLVAWFVIAQTPRTRASWAIRSSRSRTGSPTGSSAVRCT